MATKKTQLLAAINNTAELKKQAAEDRNAALDALLAVDPKKAVEFRAKVRDFGKFWSTINPNTAPDEPGMTSSATSLVRWAAGWGDGPVNSQDYLADIDLVEIQQAAAAERVKSSFDITTDKETLIAILAADECRRYLEEKIASLKTTPGWGTAPKNILTDTAVDDVRKDVATYLSHQLIASITTIADIDSISDLTTLKAKLLALGFPTEGLALIDDSSYTTIREKLDRKKEDLLRMASLAEFNNHLKELEEEELFDNEDLLRDGADFRAGIDDISEYPASVDKALLTEDEVKAMREHLDERYVQVAFAKNDVVSLTPALKETDLKQFQDALKALFPAHQQLIEPAVKTPEQMQALKKLIIPKFINELHQSINKLKLTEVEIKLIQAIAKAKNLDEFKELITKASDTIIPAHLKEVLPHLQASDLDKFRESARVHRYEMQLDFYSRLGKYAYLPLVELFKTRSAAEQRVILDRGLTLPALFHAKEASELQSYFQGITIDPAVAASIISNNERNNLFKSIFNPEIAKVLAGFNPPITLDEAKVQLINAALIAHRAEDDISDLAVYPTLIKSIGAICSIVVPGGPHEGRFNEAFGLQPDGTAYLADDKIHTAIKAQHEYNVPLLDGHDRAVSKKMVALMLRIEKKHILDISDIEHRAIHEMVLQFGSVAEFIKHYVPTIEPAAQRKHIEEQLKRELTPAFYREIRKEARGKSLAAGDEEILKDINSLVAEQHEKHRSFAEFQKKIAFVSDVQDIHLGSPLFQHNSARMQKKYGELSSQCDNIVTQLQRNKKELEDYLQDMPKLAATDPAAAAIKKTCEKLEAEIAIIDEQLDFYVEKQGRLSGAGGILKAISDAPKFALQSDFITVQYLARDQLQGTTAVPIKESDASAAVRTAATATTVAAAERGQAAQFLLEALPEPGKVQVFDVVHHVSATKKAEGRFIYDPKANDSVPLTFKGSKTFTHDAGRFEISQFPKAAPGDTIDPKDLVAAKVNFAMALAAQTVANLDRAPTKDHPLILRGSNEEELKYLWTALMVVGANNPKMKFGFNAISVRSEVFQPKTQMGRIYGFATESTYEKVFKHHKAGIIKEMTDTVKEHTKEKLDGKPVKKTAGKTEEATKFFRDSVKSTRTESQKTRHTDGAEPEPPKAPASRVK